MFDDFRFYFNDEEAILLNSFEDVVKSTITPHVDEMENAGEIEKQYWLKLGEKKFLGAIVKKDFGGLGLSYAAFAEMTRIISKASASLGLAYDIHAGLAAFMIEKYGSMEQRTELLPAFSSGKKVAAFAMTEENAGSDPSSMKCMANPTEGGYLVNGKKIFTSNAKNSDLYLLLANAVNGEKKLPTIFIVNSKQQGVYLLDKMDLLGLRALYVGSELFENVLLDKNAIVGKEGEGLKIALTVLNVARIGVAAQAVGIAEAALEYAYDYARNREAQGRTIIEFQTIANYISECYRDLYIARITYLDAAKKVDTPEMTIVSSIAKLNNTSVAKRIVDLSMQIVGGRSYLSNTPLERLMRDIKITEIYEGTNEIQKNIIYSQLRKKFS